MARRLSGLNPLSYVGVEALTPPNVYVSDSAPTTSDARNVYLGDIWLDKSTQNIYILTSVAGGTAEWMLIIGGGGATTNFTTDSGTATEVGGNINVLGDGTNISTSGSGDTVTVSMSADPTFVDLHLTGDLEVDGNVEIHGTLLVDSNTTLNGLTLTGFTNGVLTTNNSGVVGEVTTTNHSLLVGNANGTITSLGAATNGQIPIGSTGNNPTLGTITAGSGISVTNGAGTITIATTGSTGGAVTFHTDSGDATASSNAITIAGAGGVSTSGSGSTVTINASGTGITWNTVSGTSASLAAHNGYITNNGSAVTLTLPASAVVGDTFYITGLGAGGWIIAQNSGQLIHFGSAVTTTGVGGSLASTNQYNTITLVCTVTNTTFNVLGSIGNITVV